MEERGKYSSFSFIFSQNFSGLGSISNIARAEFDKVRGRNSVLRSEIPEAL
jgi:hypothetical protein